MILYEYLNFIIPTIFTHNCSLIIFNKMQVFSGTLFQWSKWLFIGYFCTENCNKLILIVTTDPAGCVHAKSFQSCLTLCNPLDHSTPGSYIHGILQARVLELFAISSSRGSGSSLPRNRTHVSLMSPVLVGEFFSTSSTWETPSRKEETKTDHIMVFRKRWDNYSSK